MAERNFRELRTKANGMLTVPIYEQLYDLAKTVPAEHSIVELGAGHGAGAAALAWGRLDSGHGGTVVTVDRMSGGSRDRFGDREANIRMAHAALAKLGVSNLVRPLWYTAEEFYESRDIPEVIGMLFIDMDGYIDRDLGALWARMTDNCTVVIDDFESLVRVERKGRGREVRIDAKHRLTYNLISTLEELGFLERLTLIGNTWFGQKAADSAFDSHRAEIRDAYRDLVHTEGYMRSQVVTRLGRRVMDSYLFGPTVDALRRRLGGS